MPKAPIIAAKTTPGTTRPAFNAWAAEDGLAVGDVPVVVAGSCQPVLFPRLVLFVESLTLGTTVIVIVAVVVVRSGNGGRRLRRGSLHCGSLHRGSRCGYES